MAQGTALGFMVVTSPAPDQGRVSITARFEGASWLTMRRMSLEPCLLVEEQVVPGAADKRCLLRLDELAVCFKLQRSDSSTLGETLLTAWGGAGLDVPNRSGNDLRATEYSICGHRGHPAGDAAEAAGKQQGGGAA
jgi:hypothetical protein